VKGINITLLYFTSLYLADAFFFFQSDLQEDDTRNSHSILILSYKTKSPDEALSWHKMNCKCYLNSTAPMAWAEARRYCRERAGELVVIGSREEQVTFIQSLLNFIGWLGLSDQAYEGKWIWVDGSPMTLQFWDRWQPENSKSNKDCAVSHTNEHKPEHTWYDYPCSAAHYVVCEKTNYK
uniref:C-type lectin domain-containing protein n=1 Tax=Denticeps clupeoides TaxID=299321 RepID=A0AAY4ARK1_9TELE